MQRQRNFRRILPIVALLLPVWLRTATPRSGASQAPEVTLPNGAINVPGRHVVVHALPIEQANARYLAHIGDSALEIYARDLGVPVPQEPFSIYLLDTLQDYHTADALYNGGTTRHNQGFSQGGRVFLLLAPRPGETVFEGGSMITRLLEHELCHALHQRLFPTYGLQPCWLREGLADAWAERAFSGIDGLMADRSPQQGTMLLALRRAARTGDFLSIAQILNQPQSAYSDSDPPRQFLTYSRSFALVRMLDDPAPANTARRLQFRAFLREVDALTGDNVAAQTNLLFRKRFGTQLPEIEAEYRRRIATEKVFPWELYSTDVALRPDGSLCAEAAPDHSALLFNTEQSLSADAHLHARIEAASLGSRQANLIFGRTTQDDYYMVAFGPHYVTLMRHEKSYTTLANRNLRPDLLPTGPHTLDLFLRPDQVEARVDGQVVALFPLRTPAGTWGIGSTDARILFRETTAQDSPPEHAY